MTKLTERQENLYHFIRIYKSKHQNSPTYEEMRGFLNVKSDNGVNKHLNALQSKGWIERAHRSPRNITLNK